MSGFVTDNFSQPNLIKFAAEFPSKLIDEEVFMSYDAILTGKMKFLSIVLNLVSKFEKLDNIHEDVETFLKNIETGEINWEDGQHLCQFERMLFEKVSDNGESEADSSSETSKAENEDYLDFKVEPNEDYLDFKVEPNDDDLEPMIIIKEEMNPDQFDVENWENRDPLDDKQMETESLIPLTKDNESKKEENVISLDAIDDQKLMTADILFSEARKKERKREQSRQSTKRYYQKNKNKEIDPERKKRKQEQNRLAVAKYKRKIRQEAKLAKLSKKNDI